MTNLFDFSSLPVLETERLLLREIRHDDVDALYALFSDPEVTHYIDLETMRHVSEAGQLIDFVNDRFDKKIGTRWAITIKAHGDELVGTIGYNVWMRHNYCGEIGYDLAKRCWGQGYMPEAIRAVVEFGFDRMNLNRVEADVTVGNEASARVLTKVGFMKEGLLRQRGYWKGGFHDLWFFSLLRSDYTAS